MKRKRGNKKSNKQKALAVAAPSEEVVKVASVNSEDNSGNDEYESGMEVDTPSSTGTDQPLNVANIKPDGSVHKAAGKSVGRVKVKLKTPKLLESDVPSHSDTDKGSPPVAISEKIEDSGNSSAEMRMKVSEVVSKKAASIKIKSSKMLGSSRGDNAVRAKGDSSFRKEPKTPRQSAQYRKQELDSALTVIKKVMKMEAAAPFNEPVNPEALGIPDYFDIIDTPMDLGTICGHLEKGDKYLNSENVYKDVQYIWDNCCKYNNKGDAILDLMRRVKKNFMKYWTAAGLYTEQTRVAESIEVEDAAVSSQEKASIKSGTKVKHQKRHGRRHKSDCLCAICVLKRRKREREAIARMAKGQSGAQESKQEDSSPAESPYGEETSLNMGESVDLDADAEVEDREKVKRDTSEQQYSPIEDRHEEDDDEEAEEEENEKTPRKLEGEIKEQLGDRSAEEPGTQSEPETTKSYVLDKSQNGSLLAQHEEENILQQQKQKESQEWKQKAIMSRKFIIENPMLLSLCGVLFPDNNNSVWSGPHSLVQPRGPSRTGSIHAAIETFMK